jgi:NAD(P)-dependent dehydrogenase (short-subunit alcohol dehydrogenase family)
MQEVSGRVAVVTGAASGIGRGMAEAFASAGMKVVISDVEATALSATELELRAAGAEVKAVVADVSKLEQVEALATETLRLYGAVHVLCNNAGVTVDSRPSWKSTMDDWDWILGVNLMGVVHGVRTFLPIMLKQDDECHIINTSSLAALICGVNTLYSTTKAAVVALSESLYLELKQARKKVNVSLLCPAYVNTNILQANRNRPGSLSDVGPLPSGTVVDVMRQWAKQQIERGLSPKLVGEKVLMAIRQERFYILTHEDWMPLVEKRIKSLLEGENPVLPERPGDELLRAMLDKTMPRC